MHVTDPLSSVGSFHLSGTVAIKHINQAKRNTLFDISHRYSIVRELF